MIATPVSPRSQVKEALLESIRRQDVGTRLAPERRLAEEFGVSSNSVERAIRKSIGVGVERAGGSKFYKVFGLSMDADKARPTNAQFIRQAALEALCRESEKNLKTAGQKRETWQIG